MDNVKYLLHSKKFKTKLAKWLGMYIGVLCLLTAVITYSRYISYQSATDHTRAAKFDVKITSTAAGCSTDGTQYTKCENENLRPTKFLEYVFEIDTTNLEVTTDLKLNIKTSKEYKYAIRELKAIDENGNPIGDPIIENGTEDNYTKTLKINPGAGSKTKYKLIIENTEINTAAQSGLQEKLVYNIVTIGYEAAQVD